MAIVPITADPDMPPAQRTRIERLNALANVLDNSIPVPGTGMRIGLDPLIGLVPGVGDAIGGLMSSYIVLQAARLGTPVSVLLRMLLNLGLEAVIGAIPVLGDLFDAGFKANLRNLALLRGSIEAPGTTRRGSMAVVLGVALALLAILGAFGFLAFVVLRSLLMLAQGEVVRL